MIKKLSLLKQWYISKIHGTIAITATVPLLNLNLNYEKLRNKNKKVYQTSKLNYANLRIF